jgi:hypothetical protein
VTERHLVRVHEWTAELIGKARARLKAGEDKSWVVHRPQCPCESAATLRKVRVAPVRRAGSRTVMSPAEG